MNFLLLSTVISYPNYLIKLGIYQFISLFPENRSLFVFLSSSLNNKNFLESKANGAKTLLLLGRHSHTQTHTQIFFFLNEANVISFEANICMRTYAHLVREANLLLKCDYLKRQP